MLALEEAVRLSAQPVSADLRKRLAAAKEACSGRRSPPTPDSESPGSKNSAFSFKSSGGAREQAPASANNHWLVERSAPFSALLDALSALPDVSAATELTEQLRSVKSRSLGAPSAPAFSRLLVASLPPSAWPSLLPRLLAACADASVTASVLDALECCRSEGSVGLPPPPPTHPALLVRCAACESETPSVRRAALETCNALFLEAIRVRRAAGAPSPWETFPLAQLIDADLPAACLAALHSPDAAVKEAGVGVFHNLAHHALRCWEEEGEGASARDAAPAYERLCMLLDREGCPLDMTVPEAEEDGASAAAAAAAAAHSYFQPVAQLLLTCQQPRSSSCGGLLGRLSRARLHAHALAAAQAPAQSSLALSGVVTLALLLDRAAREGPVEALRRLARRSELLAFQREREERVGDVLRVALEAAGP